MDGILLIGDSGEKWQGIYVTEYLTLPPLSSMQDYLHKIMQWEKALKTPMVFEKINPMLAVAIATAMRILDKPVSMGVIVPKPPVMEAKEIRFYWRAKHHMPLPALSGWEAVKFANAEADYSMWFDDDEDDPDKEIEWQILEVRVPRESFVVDHIEWFPR